MTLADAARQLGLIVEGHIVYTPQSGRRRPPSIAPALTVDWWLGRTVRTPESALFLAREYDPERGLLFEAVYLDGPASFYLSIPAASARLRTGTLKEA